MRAIVNMLRVPNLLIIALTFIFLRYLVFIPVYTTFSIAIKTGSLYFILMVTATILIAVAGYVSNDFFDVVTDKVNKPKKQYIGTLMSPGSALATAISLSFAAVIFSLWLTWLLKSWIPAVILLLALSVTWWYAIQLKKSFLWGNIAVSCMTAGTIAMAWLIEKQYTKVQDEPATIITTIISAISIFAFLLSLLREIVKDMEDIEGDKLIKCRSLPIVLGIPFTKTILLILVVFTIMLLVIAQIYLLPNNRFIAIIWLSICVEFPLIYFIYSLKKAQEKIEFHRLSTMLKWIMLGGIGSIVAGQF